MEYEIIRLSKKDYSEAIDFINMVFSMNYCPYNFPEMLPVLYKPTEEHMKCHYVIKEIGKIKALVGIYPAEIVINKNIFRMARIGAVSTHPNSQGKNMMKTLMEFATKKIKQDGYSIAYLEGLRNRYLYFGYEKCGYKMVFKLNKSNIKHSEFPQRDLTLEKQIKEDYEVMVKLNNLYKKQSIYFKRKNKDFFDICRSWNNNLYVAREKDKVVGYLVADNKREKIAELVAMDNEYKLAMLNEFFKESSVKIDVSSADYKFIRQLGNYTEEANIQDSHNWQIFDWKNIIKDLLEIKQKSCRLISGESIFTIKGIGGFRISVTAKKVMCESIDTCSNNEFSSSEFLRIAFGPLPPSLIIDLPEELKIFENWFPLPLCIGLQDGV
jgi:predicted acetyltransferase